MQESEVTNKPELVEISKKPKLGNGLCLVGTHVLALGRNDEENSNSKRFGNSRYQRPGSREQIPIAISDQSQKADRFTQRQKRSLENEMKPEDFELQVRSSEKQDGISLG